MAVISVFDIGGSKIASSTVFMAASGRLPSDGVSSIPTPVEDYAALLRTIVGNVPSEAEAAGVSIAGLVNPKAGVVRAANIPCLAGRPFREDLERETGKPVFLINDANAFGLAEASLGAGADHSSVFAVILGTGVGGAVVVDGHLLQGAGMLAGEWGHGPASAMRTGRPLPRWRCGCGQTGCIDVYGGARGLERLHLEFTGRRSCSFEILRDWEAGDAGALETLDIYLDIVGGALAGIVNLIDPSILVAGGGLAGNDKLLRALEQEMRARILTPDQAPSLVAASLPGNSALLGAALFASGELSKR
ncbi:ROK family protein [Roseibium aggregatum]|uniref:ROK family protein n=1 Tax=Roseibium aggregatum TaxID=187304 RepID=A0A939EIG0_9HYPH|nr:ROK family protein [Roseibium aggregatum]MBN9673787.1 ROK family protein [Roseibium aggregatum]